MVRRSDIFMNVPDKFGAKDAEIIPNKVMNQEKTRDGFGLIAT